MKTAQLHGLKGFVSSQQPYSLPSEASCEKSARIFWGNGRIHDRDWPALVALAAEKDNYGDPLPEGAMARVGTARLRNTAYSAPALSPDGKALYANGPAGLMRLDPATGARLGKVPVQLYGNLAAFSADGARAVHAQYDRAVVWDTGSGKTLAKIERQLPGSEHPAALSADGKTVTLAIADLKPVNQQLLKFRLKTADGTEFKQDVLHTINVIP